MKYKIRQGAVENTHEADDALTITLCHIPIEGDPDLDISKGIKTRAPVDCEACLECKRFLQAIVEK